VRSAAVVAAGLVAAVAVFQIALALGLPAGHAAWGGSYAGTLPGRLRIASAIAGLVLYPAIAVYVLTTSGLIEASWVPARGRLGMWVLTALFALGTIANLASRSPRERWWAIVSAAIAVCCSSVAIGL
jgi:hypothetical protein